MLVGLELDCVTAACSLIRHRQEERGRMLDSSPSLVEMLMWERSKDALCEAEWERLGRKIGPTRSGLLDRALASVGSLLISAGKKLQARYTTLSRSAPVEIENIVQ